MNFFIILILTALAQIFGGVVTWLALKRFYKHIRLLVVLEISIMFILSVFLCYEGLLITSYVIISLLVGIFGLYLLNITVPHTHPDKTQRLGFLVFIAMALHEFPEGIAYGSAYVINPVIGLISAASIAVHNIPEGSIVVIPYLLKKRIKRGFVALIITQLLYIIGGLLVFFLLGSMSQSAQAIAMTFAAGAMIYIVIEELQWLKEKKN
jgi:ZIP family zinc transporter